MIGVRFIRISLMIEEAGQLTGGNTKIKSVPNDLIMENLDCKKHKIKATPYQTETEQIEKAKSPT